MGEIFDLFLGFEGHELGALDVGAYVFLVLLHILKHDLYLLNNLLLQRLLIILRLTLIIQYMTYRLIHYRRDLLIIKPRLRALQTRYYSLPLMLLSVGVQVNQLIDPLHVQSLRLLRMRHLRIDNHARLKVELLLILVEFDCSFLMDDLDRLADQGAEFQGVEVLMERVGV